MINFHIKYLITTAPSVPMEGAVASAFLASQADTEAALASGSSQAGAENMPLQEESSPEGEWTLHGIHGEGGEVVHSVLGTKECDHKESRAGHGLCTLRARGC